MTPKKSRKSLGRGLDALFGDAAEETEVTPSSDDESVKASPSGAGKGGLMQLPISQLFPSPLQPRRVFDEVLLEELANSIRDKGVLQPLLVRMTGKGYEIVAGERRWRAAQRAQVHQVPALIKDLDDTEVLEVALVENLQRSDLTPMEEAEGYQRLLDEFGHSQEVLAKLMGKSRAHIGNMIRLLALPDAIKTMLEEGRLAIGHARALVGLKDAVPLAREIVDKGMSVRQVEALVKKHGKAGRPRKAAAAKKGKPKDADTKALEARLEEHLGLTVDISFDGKGGVLSFSYLNLEQLDDLIERLTQKKPTKATAISLDPNILDIEKALARRGGKVQLLREDNGSDQPDSAAYDPDPEAKDVRSIGPMAEEPEGDKKADDPVDKGIGEVMQPAGDKTGQRPEDQSEDPAPPDLKVGDSSSSGVTERK